MMSRARVLSNAAAAAAAVTAAAACLVTTTLFSAVAAAEAAAAAETADAKPLTNVDIVRMVTGGTPEQEIIRTILGAPSTAFDLDKDVLGEMRAVGVSESVIDAMKKAQKKRLPSEPPSDAAPQPAPARLTLRFEGDPNADAMSRTAVFFAADPNGAAIALGFYLVCTEPTHAPDFWQKKSPLGETISRHSVIWFHEESRPYETKRGMKDMPLSALDLPAEVTVDVTDAIGTGDTVHTISIVLMARVATGDTVMLARNTTLLKTSSGATSRLTLALSTRDAGVLKRPQRDVPPHEIRVVSVEPDPNAPAEARTEATP